MKAGGKSLISGRICHASEALPRPILAEVGWIFGQCSWDVDRWLVWWNDLSNGVPSGKRLQFANLNMAIEIVDLAIKNGDFP